MSKPVITQRKNISRSRKVNQKEHTQGFLRLPEHLKSKPLWKQIDWLNTAIVFGVPSIAFYGLFTTTHHFWQTWLFFILHYHWTMFAVTAGYHRLFSHRAFKATVLLKLFFMIFGSGSLQGSIKWWALLHRAHHRYTDTDKDPYNAKRGFFFSHCGWLLYNQQRINAIIDVSDLKNDFIIRWQHKNFLWFGPFMAFIFPCLVAGLLWNDYRGGLFIVGFLRLLCCHHATWCLNSVAHWFGDFTFDNTISPRDSFITGILTMGDGYHNFHHEFPQDYRNGIHFWDYDPTKWFIWLTSLFGLSYDLYTFPSNDIRRGELDMKQYNLDQCKKDVNYGIPIDSLPEWTQSKVDDEIQKKQRILVIIFGIVHDVTNFIRKDQHPGGKKIVINRNGKDATKDYDGGVYNHTNASRNLLSHMRVAKYVP